MNEKEILMRDPHLRKLIEEHHLSDDYLRDHIGTLTRVYESRKKCLGCKGLYMCSQSRPGERLSLSYDGILIREVEHCEYERKKAAKKDFLDSFVYSDIPENLSELDLDNIGLEDASLQGLFIEVSDILDGKRKKGLYISGDLGVGKTYMCVALANSLVKKGKKTAFVKVSDFINELRRIIVTDTQRYDETIRKLKDSEYLILDDIGSESVSSFSRDDILFPILDYRMEHKLITLFTSNLNKSDLLRYYAYDKSNKSELMRAKRLVERIDILTDAYVLQGRNKRRES